MKTESSPSSTRSLGDDKMTGLGPVLHGDKVCRLPSGWVRVFLSFIIILVVVLFLYVGGFSGPMSQGTDLLGSVLRCLGSNN